MADLESVLADLARRLGDCGVPYMVIGGMANAVWGYPRSTVDLVLHKVVSTRERDRQDVWEILKRRYASLDRSYLDPRVHELAVLLERPELEESYLQLLDAGEI